MLSKLVALNGERRRFADLASEIALSVAETHKAFRRLVAARLVDEESGTPVKSAAEEFLVHGAKYAFPARRGGLTRGTPTGFAASPLSGILAMEGVTPAVWPHPDGLVRGYELEPLYPSAPVAAGRDPALYEILALVDAIRDGSARERAIAAELLAVRIRGR